MFSKVYSVVIIVTCNNDLDSLTFVSVADSFPHLLVVKHLVISWIMLPL